MKIRVIFTAMIVRLARSQGSFDEAKCPACGAIFQELSFATNAEGDSSKNQDPELRLLRLLQESGPDGKGICEQMKGHVRHWQEVGKICLGNVCHDENGKSRNDKKGMPKREKRKQYEPRENAHEISGQVDRVAASSESPLKEFVGYPVGNYHQGNQPWGGFAPFDLFVGADREPQ